MSFDFATLLVIAALVTGSIYALDVFVLAPRRPRIQGDGAPPASNLPKTPENAAPASPQASLPWYIDFSRSFFPVILVVLVLRSFMVEPFRIPSGSMMPTLEAGDFILVNKFNYGLRLPVTHHKILPLGEPERGDVVVFRYPRDPSTAYIKRIVALPGDRVAYRDKQLYIDGEPLPQTRLHQGSPATLQERAGERKYTVRVCKDRRGPCGAVPSSFQNQAWEREVPPGHYFVMGDNRDFSADSRVWGFLPESHLIGEAFAIWMNFNCITLSGQCNRIGTLIE
ncbi:MAG: signal peptidase I [Candidatus Competibacterales bacterium]